MTEGIYKFSNGNSYEGTFAKNKAKNGTLYIKNNINKIKYTVTNGIISNKFSVQYNNGDHLYGYFSNNLFNGSVRLTYTDGSSYHGDIVDSKRNGSGSYQWKSGQYYEGNWTDDSMNGYGTYYYKGQYNYPKISGSFKNGVPDGECTYYQDENTSYSTQWTNGQCTKVSE